MGNSTTNNSIAYTTKEGYNISYLYWDLKGKNRFPDHPGESQINFMLQRCLEDINADEEQLKQIKDFNNKYKYRFVVLHKRKLAEAKKEKELEHFKRKSSEIHLSTITQTQEEKPKFDELELLMKDVELNQTVIKVALMKIDKFITEKYAAHQFIRIEGFQRLIQLLDKAIHINNSGTRTNFSNQIQLLKFFKIFSDRYPKDFFTHIHKISNYVSTIIKTYHPINTHITAYCLILITDYFWRVEEGEDVIQVLENYKKLQNLQSFLSPFVESISQTDSIIMVYYNLKFINELIAAVIEEEKKENLKQNLNFVKYGFVLESVKLKLERAYYNIENSTFISMHQKIFKFATKSKTEKRSPTIFMEENNQNRTIFNMNDLQQLILKSFFDNDNNINNEDEEIEQGLTKDEMIVAYIGQSDRKRFNKFVLDTLTEIQKYNKLEYYLEVANGTLQSQNQTPQFIEAKMNMQSLESYISRIKQSCVKNNCNEILINAFKNLQYFEKSQWKNLERFILEELGLEKKIIEEVEQLKILVQQKQNIVKRVLKQNNQLKVQLLGGDNENANTSFDSKKSKGGQKTWELHENMHNFKKKFDASLPLPPNKNNKKQNNEELSLIGKFSSSEKPMRDKPKLIICKLKQISITIQNESLKTNLPTQLNTANFNHGTLQHPPILNTYLPPPPPLGILNLPPPPLLGSLDLPPPPPLGSLNLPPPPPLESLNLPPPPSLANLPPPLFGSQLLLQPSLNILNTMILPPPPPFNGIDQLPQTLSQHINLPTIPVINLNFQQPVQKIKQKRRPKVPLKTCNYTVLGYDKIVNTIFQQIDDTKIELNENQINQLFGKNIQNNLNINKQDKNQTQKTGNGLELPPKPKQIIKLLGSDRWRNIEIVLTKLKIPVGEMFKALTSCTGKYVSHSILESVDKILPNEEQEQMIKSYEGSDQDLGKPQRFMREIIEVKEYTSRVKAMIFSNIKEEFFYELSSKFIQLKKGFESLKKNNRLRCVIEVCLALGNYLNGVTLKGGAWGFKLQTIQRIEQVKSADNKTNAAFYLIKQVWKKYPYPIFEKDEIEMYQYLSKMPISQLGQDLGELNIYNRAIKRAYESHDPHNFDDNFGSYCEQMMIQMNVKIQEYKAQNQQLKKLFAECAQFYCQDSTKISSDELGKKMFQCILFVSNTEKIYKTIVDKKSKEQNRKALRNEMTYATSFNSISNPETIKKQDKSARQSQIITLQHESVKLPGFNKLPPPPLLPLMNKEQKLKQIQKIQLEREKKALEEVMIRRTSKLQAYRKSKMGQNNKKNTDSEIDFLKGVK